jgi:hypothetical protein
LYCDAVSVSEANSCCKTDFRIGGRRKFKITKETDAKEELEYSCNVPHDSMSLLTTKITEDTA